jgi:hypothetical protein
MQESIIRGGSPYVDARACIDSQSIAASEGNSGVGGLEVSKAAIGHEAATWTLIRAVHAVTSSIFPIPIIVPYCAAGY